MSRWSLVYEGAKPARAGVRETLCTLGNGYFATRGAPPECRRGGEHYPGTYVAGCYDRASSTVQGHRVENEDLVNAPDWLPLTFRADDGDWFDEPSPDLPQRMELDMRRGLLTRTFHVVDGPRTTRVTQRRLVSMHAPHLAALETTLLPENWSGTAVVRSALDGRVTNAGVDRYRDLNGLHLSPLGTGSDGPGLAWLHCRTLTSAVELAYAARTRITQGALPTSPKTRAEEAWVATDLALELTEGQQTTVEKVVALHTSRDHAVGGCLEAARLTLARAGTFDELLHDHTTAWRHLWRTCALSIEDEEEQMVLNLHIFHILQTLSPHTADLDVGVPARGLHGEAYRGHVFWDELFVLPFLNLRLPETARALLRYRWRRLPQARAAAAAAGLRGALFPWQSATDGREETQSMHLNPRSGHWIADNSHLQRHVGLAIAYNVWQHYQATGDHAFLSEFGAELIIDIARAFADMCSYDKALDRYTVRGVMGPDEYHDGYPDRTTPGLDDNAYTNIMAVWVMLRALDVLRILPRPRLRALEETLGLGSGETERFEDVTRKMHVPFHEGVISQFAGYEELKELDWDAHRGVRRLDRALEAEGESCNGYKASKQADALMLFFLLPAEELAEILRRLGYAYDPGLIPRTVDYYLARTSHGSTLSSVVHSWVLSRTDREASWVFFREALRGDIEDAQGGTTGEGIHLGAMAGTVDLLTRCYTGLATMTDALHLSPLLPGGLSRLSYDLRYHDHWEVRLDVHPDHVRITVPPSKLQPIEIRLKDRTVSVAPGSSCVLPLSR
ncbi:glycoside hydrolase family 65 protein [Nocardiopsis changdeensis]|uniref:Glycoside hydrolase family 65 protein n=1 Tax=Nocardiopsis changdeensis TaxID=2831969 RepID=A0ABX8BH15_9ACTN|nr:MULTISPECIES: glycosyl hydrolase family 65 protein [Nocardiopsis]QUX20654.1 glycoside hydrolase family 65 protein [Nocardiopsis changdeensis]QYX36586.1 glycoside hydrolase family 65 protein [Nocardiopsis sp. MT53]